MVSSCICFADDHIEVNIPPMTWGGDKVPPSSQISEGQVGSKDTAPAVQLHQAVLDMHMVDMGSEITEEECGIESLPLQVTWIEVDPKGFSLLKLLQETLGAVIVIRDLRGGVYLKGKLHALLVELIKDWSPEVVDLLVAILDQLLTVGRE